MAREIKFRAWHSKSKTMILSPGVYDSNLGPYTITFDGQVYSAGYHKDFLLMQYTGLKDKNGKEIYEGDVVRSVRRYPINSETAKKFNHYVGQIYYDVELGSWWITTNPTNGFDHEHTCQEATLNAFEVIGNIYENPNLLEDTKGE